MNIVMFSKKNPDYLHDLVYHGFRQLGHTVVDFPRKENLHLKSATNLLDFTWEQQDIVGPRADILLICAQPADMHGGDEYERLLHEALRTYDPKKIAILDGHDVQVPYYPIDRPYDAVFKRELFKTDVVPSNYHQMSFAPREESLVLTPYKDKDIDFLYMGSYSGQPFRAKVLQSLAYYAHRYNLNAACSLGPCPRDQYIELVRRSKVVISVRGFGWDCYRYWETPALGTLMLTEEIPLRINNDFGDGVDCRKFITGDTNDMERVLTEILQADPDDLSTMAVNAWNKVQRFHTPVHRARQILEVLK